MKISKSIEKFLIKRALEVSKSQKFNPTRCLQQAVWDYPDLKKISRKKQRDIITSLLPEFRKQISEIEKKFSLSDWLKTPEAIEGAEKNQAFHENRAT